MVKIIIFSFLLIIGIIYIFLVIRTFIAVRRFQERYKQGMRGQDL